MKKRLLRLLFLSGTLLILLTACEYDFITPAPPVPIPPANDTISYAQDIQPFFTAKCVSCHGGSIAPNLLTGQSYSTIVPSSVTAGNPETSSFYTDINTGGSMASYATPAERQLVYRWIFAGAKNN